MNRRINDYKELLLDTDYLEREASHLLFGDYGEDIYFKARSVVQSRMNKVAWLSQQLAIAIFNLTSQQAREVYLSLSGDDQEKANKVLTDLINGWDDDTDYELTDELGGE